MPYCSYFQANVQKKETWFFVATLRSYEHYAFDRTYDKASGLFEFFVPQSYEHRFIELMQWYQDNGMITNFKKVDNRLYKLNEGF